MNPGRVCPLVLAFMLPFGFASRLAADTFDIETATVADINHAFDAGALTSQQLVQLCLDRINAYEPKLHAIITLNKDALAEARQLDLERKKTGPRSPLHGIPVLFKDNINTSDLPTTGGFYGLQGSIPPRDATVVQKLRAAGAIILAKVNLSELAAGACMSSLGGQTHNPHNLDITPSGSSGGTGASIAAAYATIGFGSDTMGSIRAPSASNGIVGLKPTYGLVSCAGVIPLAHSLDTVGPMTRSVYDVAVTLGIIAGPDPRDFATSPSAGHVPSDYTRYLKGDALKGARIGVARDFFGNDPEVDRVAEEAVRTLRAAGAEVVDVRCPEWVLLGKQSMLTLLHRVEFKAQIVDYLADLGPSYPKNLPDIIALSEKLTEPHHGIVPNPSRLAAYRAELAGPPLSDPVYLAARNQGRALIRASMLAVFSDNRLDAIVYPTSTKRPPRIDAPPDPPERMPEDYAANIANLSGFPDLSVPAGFSSDGLPIDVSFSGTPFSEPKILGLGYAFEQRTHALHQPANTPPLPGERFSYASPSR